MFFINQTILLNLFVLGLIEQFEQFFQLQNSLIQTYVENVDKIKTVWCKYSSETQGQAMNYKFLCKFLLDIGKPLGGSKEENLWDVAKLASSFKLKCDHYGYIQYNQLMYELFRRCFINEVFREGTESSIVKIKQFNKEMQLRLMYYRKNRLLERTNISPSKQLKANFNILHDYLTVLILFKTWESYSKLVFLKIEKEGNFSDSDDIVHFINFLIDILFTLFFSLIYKNSIEHTLIFINFKTRIYQFQQIFHSIQLFFILQLYQYQK